MWVKPLRLPTVKLSITQRLCIIMSPEYAKVVGDSLVKAAATFEKQFGKLRPVEISGRAGNTGIKSLTPTQS